MNFRKILRNKKAVSAAIAAVFLIGVALFAVGILYSTLDMSYESKVDDAGVIIAKDYDNDGLIDTITIPLVNDGISDADIETIVVKQAGVDYLWYSMDSGIDMSSVEEITMYALGVSQQIEPLVTFNVEITFGDSVYTSHGLTVTLPATLGEDDVVEGDPFIGYNPIVPRNSEMELIMNKVDCGEIAYIYDKLSVEQALKNILKGDRQYTFSGSNEYTWDIAASKYFQILWYIERKAGFKIIRNIKFNKLFRKV